MKQATKPEQKRTAKKQNPSRWADIVALSKALVPSNTGVLRHVARAY